MRAPALSACSKAHAKDAGHRGTNQHHRSSPLPREPGIWPYWASLYAPDTLPHVPPWQTPDCLLRKQNSEAMLFFLLFAAAQACSIDDFGAIACVGKACHHQPTESVTKVNSAALIKAFA